MDYVLRIVGGFWILFTFKDNWLLVRRIFHYGPAISVGLHDLLWALLLAGGIGLLVSLREWARWILVVCCALILVLKVLPGFQIQAILSNLRPILFYGFFIVLLMLPQSRGATRK